MLRFSYLRQKGHLSSGYIDDSYLQGDEYQDCLANVVDTLKLFDSLGFIIHPVKSVFIPTQTITFLGFILDSRNMTVSLTQQKQLKLKNACLHIIKVKRPTIRLIAQLLGLMGPCITVGLTWKKPNPSVGILRVPCN